MSTTTKQEARAEMDAANALEAKARALLKHVELAKVSQCFYLSLGTGAASPIRVYVELNQEAYRANCPKPKSLPVPSAQRLVGTTDEQRREYKARYANWKEAGQILSGQVMTDAQVTLNKAGIKTKLVRDYGWYQLTLS